MNIIKLDAIDSTNRFLKDLAKNGKIENFTTVVANHQTQGKGQQNTTWFSSPNQNLLCTVCVDLQRLDLSMLPVVNFLVATTIRKVVASFLSLENKIAIKWPNDIMSYQKKIAGILVENTIKSHKLGTCFIGLGLNVNQQIFPDYLSKASSMALIEKTTFDRDEILTELIHSLKEVMTVSYITKYHQEIKEEYLGYLYRLGIPSVFRDVKGSVFMGMIVDVSRLGKLVVEKEDEKQYEFDVKEITFL
ncbi:biotin--[acetyl-CoA-carboxylase] ligase [Ochrovirga pacifica]|uniref:biotin--[acetyl-CoA-carboxylase] ligase n=1 Tax=Ochrovirga pacifica TaxID=1042376 RepID=UPI000255A798|nr:biotin--[acetyl-CoA-carboxylase] ligase [Ochrovirga pacifica]